ncbi:dienelactone hydrolase family protein [Vitiosangium sp. GDMCC 1.1324]|uniref:dienelactone hydrolase family protein n=1 Tax=Vitiosangium sp. (strain GDMCC 1.1324) TaxID=2138576 RepID=UPI000D368928|nr:dienelactone hydrolase family protein [Vitiosangium sp. GDMCC 1.1324]PTL75025.1 dienelactone hydrolase [Vitiosangium sp. GDMCC 1.1324]
MAVQDVELKTREGTMDAKLFHPDGQGQWPAVILLTDAFGIRPVFEAMANRLVAAGYVVLLPNVYYREGRAPLPNLEGSFSSEEGRKRIYGLIGSLTPERVKADAAAELDFLAGHAKVKKGSRVGVVGYCMGGSMVVRFAADFPERIAAAASFHGGRLATDAPDSPHRVVGKVKGELYFAHADQDASMPAEAIAQLETALKTAGVKHQSELYTGARHGFAVEGSAVYDKDASERHWSKLLELFGRTLRA